MYQKKMNIEKLRKKIIKNLMKTYKGVQGVHISISERILRYPKYPLKRDYPTINYLVKNNLT